ncbi:MAG: hypothetical protein ACPGGE_05205, partial [Poseidonia sp.]
VAIANVAKVDAVTKANIADINGLTIPSGFTGLLDESYGSGAAAAYSVRRLASATTVLLRVRRDTAGGTGDDDEADVAYDSNNELSLDSAISNASAGVTATTLGQFINVGTVGGTTYTNPDSLTVTASCYVDTWYDQAGSNHAEQATHGSQPQIHAGTVDTDLVTVNGVAALDFTADYMAMTTDTTLSNGAYFAASVFSLDSATSFNMIMGADKTGVARVAQFLRNFNGNFATVGFNTGGGNVRIDVPGSAASTQYLGIGQADGTNLNAFRTDSTGTDSGTAKTHTNTTTATKLAIGAQDYDGALPMTGTVQEAILWPLDKSSVRSSITTNITTDFGI